ncbi:unnamed protein product [Blepharisma stoltei]|uniref:Uncharacterized protein n=1 Tax=Blepharisma stoltei TaxID=1481888 RepID=A0AAU9IGH5_9CILI|nr:unnamed protein product [Blepharisma stoltei]
MSILKTDYVKNCNMDSACESTTSERNINESEIMKYLIGFSDDAIEFIKDGQTEDALDVFIKCQELIESVINQGENIDPDMIITISHNIAVCHQNLNNYEKSIESLERSLPNRNSIRVQNSTDQSIEIQIARKIFRDVYQCKTNLNLWATSSKLKKHEASLLYARKSVGNVYEILQDCFKLCTNFILRYKKLQTYNKAKAIVMNSNNVTENYVEEKYKEVVERSFPVVDYLNQIILEKLGKKQKDERLLKSNTRAVDGIQTNGDAIFNLTIEELIMLRPITYHQFKAPSNFIIEISKQSLCQKICLLAISYYSIATELWHLRENYENKISEGKSWHSKSLEIAEKLIPFNSPILRHIKESYYERYPPSLTQNIFIKKVKDFSQTRMTDKEKKLKSVYGRSASVKPHQTNFLKTIDKFQSRTKTPALVTKQNSIKSSKSPSRNKRKSITDREKKDHIVTNFNKTARNLKGIKELGSSENKASNKSTTNLIKTMKIVHISDDSSANSESSFDEDYFRENFVLTSNDLYGVFSDEETNNENKKKNLSKQRLRKKNTETSETSNENEVMPALRLINPDKVSAMSSSGFRGLVH